MKRAFTLIEAVVVVAIIVILAAILFPVFARTRCTEGRRPVCQSNLKQIGLAFIQYAQDYDERFPPARLSGAQGWADGLQPYCKSRQLFQCPSAPTAMADDFSTDYFYNQRLARVTQQKVPSVAQTILAGDGDDNAPTWNSWAQLPSDALINEQSPAQRHLGVGNYLFADGHVKSCAPGAISNKSPLKFNGLTFAVR